MVEEEVRERAMYGIFWPIPSVLRYNIPKGESRWHCVCSLLLRAACLSALLGIGASPGGRMGNTKMVEADGSEGERLVNVATCFECPNAL